jgi:anti-sigma factor RsiW
MNVRIHDTPADGVRDAGPMTDQHLSVATIASYVDGTLDPGARAEADLHLATCADCRAELSGVAQLIIDLPKARRNRSWYAAAGMLAAAGVVGLLLSSPARAPERTDTPLMERATRPVATTLEIVEPAAAAGAGPLHNGTIVWRAVEPKATYRVTVTDTTGATRWSAETSDTAAVLPPSVRLAGARYYLYVDALRADGWSLQSGPRAFTITP